MPKTKTTTVITYGTYDLIHIGHVRMLERLSGLGDRLIVGISTDEFNTGKGKRSIIPFEQRKEIVESIRYVDLVIAEDTWEQKTTDIVAHNVDIFGIGDDWQGQFDFLKDLCEVVYLPRTSGISTTELKDSLSTISNIDTARLRDALDILSNLVRDLS